MKFKLKYGSLKNRYLKRSNSCDDEVELRVESKVITDEINRLKEEVRNNKNISLSNETENELFLSDLKYEEKDVMNNIMTSETKLRKLKIPSSYIIGIKHLILSA